MEPTKKNKVDAYTQNVMNSIEPTVFKTLNLVQLEAIRQSVSANAPFRKHSIDIRGSIPLYITKFYFVFLIGKDRRSSTREKEIHRKEIAKGVSILGFIYIILTLSIPILFIFLYALKSFLGIDIFPDRHLNDLFDTFLTLKIINRYVVA